MKRHLCLAGPIFNRVAGGRRLVAGRLPRRDRIGLLGRFGLRDGGRFCFRGKSRLGFCRCWGRRLVVLQGRAWHDGNASTEESAVAAEDFACRRLDEEVSVGAYLYDDARGGPAF